MAQPFLSPLPQAKQREDEQNHDDQADEINQTIHGALSLSCRFPRGELKTKPPSGKKVPAGRTPHCLVGAVPPSAPALLLIGEHRFPSYICCSFAKGDMDIRLSILRPAIAAPPGRDAGAGGTSPWAARWIIASGDGELRCG